MAGHSVGKDKEYNERERINTNTGEFISRIVEKSPNMQMAFRIHSTKCLTCTLQISNWVLYIWPLQPQAQSGHIDIYVERPIELEGIWYSDNLRDLMTGNLFGAYPVHV